MNQIARNIITLTLFCCAFFALPGHAINYTMQEIPETKSHKSEPADRFNTAYLNNNGLVLGFRDTLEERQVLLYDPSTNEITTLASIPFSSSHYNPVEVRGFNDLGQTLISTPSGTAFFLCDKEHGLQEIHLGHGKATRLNNQGKLCHQDYATNEFSLWHNGTITPQPLPDVAISKFGVFGIRELNDKDMLFFDAVIDHKTVNMIVDLTKKDPNPKRIPIDTVFSINNDGDAFGLDEEYSYRIWCRDTGKILKIPSDIHFPSTNDKRQVTGSNGNGFALTWNKKDGTIFLNDCTVNLDKDTRLVSGWQINNKGQILVLACRPKKNSMSDEYFNAILTPIDE
jgi:hypothetical protein